MQGRTAYGGWRSTLCGSFGDAANTWPGRSVAVITDQLLVGPLGVGTIHQLAPSCYDVGNQLHSWKHASWLTVRRFLPQSAYLARHAHRSLGLAPSAPKANREVGSLEPRPFVDEAHASFVRHFDTRWALGGYPFSSTEHSAAQIFARLRHESIASEAHLVMMCDVIPPSAIAMFKTPAMISSMNWTLEMVTPLSAESANGWLRFDAEVTAAGDGYAWENTSIWGSSGELIALSRWCVAGVRLRNPNKKSLRYCRTGRSCFNLFYCFTVAEPGLGNALTMSFSPASPLTA